MNDSTEIPKIWIDRLQVFERKILELSTRYQYSNCSCHRIFINTHPTSLKRIPEFHLKELSSLFYLHKELFDKPIEKHAKLSTTVTFLNNHLKPEIGSDSGGITRGYFNLLFSNLLNCQGINFHHAKDSLLLMPIARQSLQSHPINAITKQEHKIFCQIGRLLISCYRVTSKIFNIGKIFDDALFHTIFCLTADEIDTPFKQLSKRTLLKMCHTMVCSRIDAGEDLNLLLKKIQLCLKKDQAPSKDLQDVVVNEFHAGGLSESFITDNQPDMDKVNKQLQKFLDDLANSIFDYQSESLGKLGALLAPIHAMAIGMKSMMSSPDQPNSTDPWFNSTSPKFVSEFILKVQGSLDREEISQRITFSESLPSELLKKISWMKEWITDSKDGATESELRNFLKFYTGSNALLPGQDIIVSPQYNKFTPIPHAHSCAFRIDISPVPCGDIEADNDRTKESFYKILRELNAAQSTEFNQF